MKDTRLMLETDEAQKIGRIKSTSSNEGLIPADYCASS